MLSSGLMSEINTYKKLSLGQTEKIFLHIISIQPTSVYRISVGLKNGFIGIGGGIVSTGIKSMAYKNVHKRIKRLCALGLIEEIHGNFKRNAKMYTLTPRGLFERLLDDFPIPPDIVYLYRNYPIVETLIYQYFELETIKNFEDIALDELKRYLKNCCESILSTLEAHRHETEFIKSSQISNSEVLLKEHDSLLSPYIDVTIKYEAKKFVFKIVDMSKDEDPYQTEKDNRSYFPRQALIKDKRFIGLLQEIKSDFNRGCENYL